MTVLVILSTLFLLCPIVAMIRARATQADAPIKDAAITPQHVDHDEGLWGVGNAQVQLRASIHTSSGSRLLGEKLAAAQAHRLQVIPAPRSDSG